MPRKRCSEAEQLIVEQKERTADQQLAANTKQLEENTAKRAKQDTQQSRDDEWKSRVNEFLASEWEILSNSGLKLKTPSLVQEPSVNYANVPKSWKGQPIKFLLHILPLQFWMKLARSVNSIMTRRLTEGLVSKSYQSRLTSVNEIDMIHFFAVVLYVGNASSSQLNNIEKIIHTVDQDVHKMGVHRFHAVMSSLQPTNAEFDELVGMILQQCVASINVGTSPVVSIDESLYEYQV